MPDNKIKLRLLFDVGVSKKAEIHFKELRLDVLAVRDINASRKMLTFLNLLLKSKD